MINNSPDIIGIILNVVLTQVNNSKRSGVFQMRRLEQREYLRPVSALKRILIHLLNKLDNHRRVLDLRVDGTCHRLRLISNDLALGGLISQELGHLVDRLQDYLQVEVEEGRREALVALLRPVQEHLPHLDCVFVDFFHEFAVGRARELAPGQLLLCVLIVFV